MWADLQNSLGVPICVSLWISCHGTLLADLDDPRQQEVLEHLVVMATRTSVPAEPVEGQCMWLDPACAGLRAGHGLIGYLEGSGRMDRTQNISQGLGRDPARRCWRCTI